MEIKNNFLSFLGDSVLNSYSQIFFSKKKILSVLILLATFLNPGLGFWGLLGVVFTNSIAYVLGFNQVSIKDGLFGLNSLLVILGLSVFFKLNITFIFVFLAINIFTLILSVGLSQIMAKNGLPFLAFPFVIGIWVTFYVMNTYTNLEVNEGSVYFLNDIFKIGGSTFIEIYEAYDNIPLPDIIKGYFKSLSAIIFQFNWIAGLLISIGILISSRISFLLSIIGYLTGYLYFYIVGENIQNMEYGYIGFNFILFAIAIGSFYFISKKRIHLAVIVLTPVLGLLITGLSGFLSVFNLPVFSLPFMFMTTMIIYVMNFTSKKDLFPEVVYQTYSPEKNLYNHFNYFKRFGKDQYVIKIGLPFFGKWKVWQGQSGKHTHKGDWKDAWDFVITDKDQKTYKKDGLSLNDYYCYQAPVVSPADGTVVNIIDGISDNEPGDIDMEHNWGNTIVIKHTHYLFSQISHLKHNSFKVNIGDFVKKGEQIASLGNSGRSPQPHLHFQLQTTPYIGSKTLKYPLSYYINHSEKGEIFESFKYPKEGDEISDVKINKSLNKAFKLVPGMIFKVSANDENFKSSEWEVHTDAYNATYITCSSSGAYAYFVNNGTLLYFTSFEGDKNSLLYYFYLSCFKIFLGEYKSLKIDDYLPIHSVFSGFAKYLQDSVASYYLFCRAIYSSRLTEINKEQNSFLIQSSINKKIGQKSIDLFDFKITGGEKSIDKIVVKNNTTHFEIYIEQLINSLI